MAGLLRRSPVPLVVLLLAVTASVFERGAFLPEPAHAAVVQIERWLGQILGQLGARRSAWPEPAVPGQEQLSAHDHAAAAQALVLLATIAVEPEHRDGYARDDWPHWLDLDGDCRSARHEVLASESLRAVVWNASGCLVQSGTWRDAYTGRTWSSAADMDIDHLVPLAEAHRSGGYAWSQRRRIAFANDLEDSRSLIAVSASANRSKGDQGPEEWLPPLAAYHCRYVADWVGVKARWSLSMDERERMVVSNILRSCNAR